MLRGSVLVLAIALAGCDPKPSAPSDPNAVAVTANGKGFSPSSVTFKKGAPATMIFTRTTDDTCATEVVFPQLDVKKDLPKNKPIAITIPTDKEQTLTFQCGMGMYKSSVVVAVN
ncbi:MAG: cupredoxin domain-containing protein [Labilithrix sp.]|nr:cupredoxin domain-containing protein [Labilithrix sp.]